MSDATLQEREKVNGSALALNSMSGELGEKLLVPSVRVRAMAMATGQTD